MQDDTINKNIKMSGYRLRSRFLASLNEDQFMVIGVTMVKVIPDHEKEVYNALRERDGIKEVYNLFGEYDLFVILEAQRQAELGHIHK